MAYLLALSQNEIDLTFAAAVAGVMGGGNSEVGAATTRVFLESAYFAPGSIRRTSRALGLRTDAAYRFERGADIEALVDAGARAAQLMADLAGGTADWTARLTSFGARADGLTGLERV